MKTFKDIQELMEYRKKMDPFERGFEDGHFAAWHGLNDPGTRDGEELRGYREGYAKGMVETNPKSCSKEMLDRYQKSK